EGIVDLAGRRRRSAGARLPRRRDHRSRRRRDRRRADRAVRRPSSCGSAGGRTGLSAAYHLAPPRPGARVVLLEADGLGGGASGRNTGMLGPGVGQSLPALAARLGRAPAASLYRATLEAVSDVRSLCGREGIACDLQMTGQLLRARSRGDRRRLGRQAALMAELELPFERLDDEATARRLRLSPAPGDDGDCPAALRFAHAGLLHPGKLVAGLASAATARGATLYTRGRVGPGGGGRGGRRR